MMFFAVMTLGSQLVLAADEVPTLKVEQSCRSAATAAIIVGRTADNCLNDEKSAREQLVQNWKQFSASDKSHCMSLVQTGGGASYVELLSCLEMSRDARAISQDRAKTEPAPEPGNRARRRPGAVNQLAPSAETMGAAPMTDQAPARRQPRP
jgi:hypothetical protein